MSEQAVLNMQWNNEALRQRVLEEELAHWQRMNFRHVIYKPRVFKDGDKWCALLGLNIQEGVCGFGNTPEEACLAFDKEWDGVRP